MILNHEEIKSRGIIEGAIEEEFSEGSYNLTVDHVVNMNNVISDSFTIKPQGMVYVVFKEKLNVPDNVIGFAHVKTTLTKRGIMATNIGIIDPCYKGYISTLLINFGKSDCFISKGDEGLRVTFATIVKSLKPKKLSKNNLDSAEYIKAVQNNVTNLDEKFLNLNTVEKSVFSAVITKIVTYSIVFTAGSFLIGIYFQRKNSEEKDLDRAIRKYETELSIMTKENLLLQKKLDVYDYRMKSMEDSFKVISSRVTEKKGGH